MADGAHVVLTGPIQGLITLADGREVNVSPDQIVVEAADVAEVVHQIGMHYYKNGHPDDIEEVEPGKYVQRPFDYQPSEEFASDLEGVTPKGTPHDETPEG